jgi:hypothetical protein
MFICSLLQFYNYNRIKSTKKIQREINTYQQLIHSVKKQIKFYFNHLV